MLAEVTSPLMAASALVGATVRGEETARPVNLPAATAAPSPDARPSGDPTTADELALTMRRAIVADLHRGFPHAMCWWGETTQQWWAYLVLNTDRALISANSPYRLADRISEITTKAPYRAQPPTVC
ncbi:hypothetical protein [Actinomadura sp. 7K507]|uniref:hypothetical protein n=1 Tax=Actinomadura sp. 7K507 TaxID=2530365 RepID=UPI001048B558|nr:hypothetical protein [Actinomadura sp. 7K507]TDC96129.1 hypothetical protein E1285_05965 [Actinomadura sp. 7K507]